METYSKYVVVSIAGALTAYLLTPVVRRMALRWGIVDEPDDRRIHEGRIPRLGGVAVFLAFHAACAALFLFPWAPFEGKLTLAWWLRFLPLSGAVLAIGIVDDVRGLSPWFKLLLEAVVVGVAFALGNRIGVLLGIPLPLWADFLFTQAWCLGLMNAFNLIDGMDGLAIGLAAIGALGIAGHQLLLRAPGDSLVAVGLVGAAVGFLRYNFHPASIFLGDSGSLFLGFTIATISLGAGAKSATAASLAVPLLAAGVPLFDAMLAVWRRSVRRLLHCDGAGSGGIMAADMEHLHHRLLGCGVSQRGVAGVLYALSGLLVCMGLGAVALGPRGAGVYLLAFVVGSYLVFRHLAWVELWDTGAAIVRGVNRPSGRVSGLILYPILDLATLSASLALSIALTSPNAGVGIPSHEQWLAAAPYGVGVPFILLGLSKAYSRVWSLARISEYVLTAGAAVAGVFVAAGMEILLEGIAPASVFRRMIVHALLCAGGVVASRSFLRGVHDLMQWFARVHDFRAGAARAGKARRIVLCGVDYRCTLFLREHGYRFVEDGVDRVVVGLLDDNRGLRRRTVHGYRVLGAFDELPSIAREYALDEVFCVGLLSDAQIARVCDIGRSCGVRVVRWNTQAMELS